MKQHETNKGNILNVDAIRAKNSNVIAVGNMKVNGNGDRVSRGVIVEPSASRVRTHSVVSSVETTIVEPCDDIPGETPPVEKAKPTKKKKQIELDNGDIMISGGDDNDGN